MCRPTRPPNRGRLLRLGEMSEDYVQPLPRGTGGSMYTRKAHATREAPMRDQDDQPDAREGQAGRIGVAERPVVPMKPGNAGGGKGPQFKADARRGEGPGDWATYQLRTAFRNCRRRYTRKRRQNPATASTPSTTRSAARTFWRTPMLSAAPTRARRAWTVRTSRPPVAHGLQALGPPFRYIATIPRCRISFDAPPFDRQRRPLIAFLSQWLLQGSGAGVNFCTL